MQTEPRCRLSGKLRIVYVQKPDKAVERRGPQKLSHCPLRERNRWTSRLGS